MKRIAARRVPALLAGLTAISVVALGWLGVRTLRQDRELENQRQREQLEVAAGRLALQIERRLQEIEERLAQGVGVRFLPTGIEPNGDRPVLFQPIDTPPTAISTPVLADAESDEFQRRDFVAAEAGYRRVASTASGDIRAAALVALGRVRRQRHDYDGAVAAYRELEGLGAVLVAGQPAALVARQARCKTFESSGQSELLRLEVRGLSRAIEAGTWPIDRQTFDLYQRMVAQWGGPSADAASIARTEAAAELWRAWRNGDLPSRGRRLLTRSQVPVMAVWTGDIDHLTASLVTGAELEAAWHSLWDAQMSVSLSDVDGRRFIGPSLERALSLSPSDTRLPFILSVSSVVSQNGIEHARRSVLLIGLVVTLALMIAAAYAAYRTTMRELALARQQADFVAAVSHEFRTPLTSMRHLTDLLVSRTVTSDERKAQYYELLARETERLHRMVESLLSFGRMDVDAYAWQLEVADVDPIVRGIVDEFRREPIAAGRLVHCAIDAGLPPIRADREALSRALWNLLENAGKYSNAGTSITVFASRQGAAVLLGVSDEGIGIPATEQRRIFQKFVRGGEAVRTGVRGVGLGLALVTRIAEAHGGSVRLESEPGRGSTFTLVLPCPES